MSLTKHIVDAKGRAAVVEMNAEAEAAFLASSVPKVRVPQTISRFQGRAWLLQNSKLEAAEALVAAQDEITRLAWAEVVEFQRSSAVLNALAPELDIDLDTLFTEAAQIRI